MEHDVTRPLIARCIAFSLSFLFMGQQLSAQQPPIRTGNEGYLFLDGKYVQPPYQIQYRDDLVIINGQEFAADYFDLSGPQREFDGGPGKSFRRGGMAYGSRSQGKRGRSDFSPIDRAVTRVQEVRDGAIVVLYRKQKPVVLYTNGTAMGHELLCALAGQANADTDAPPQFPASYQTTWTRLVSEFQPNDEFLTRATADIDEVQEATIAGDRTIAANMLVAQISYPLTVFAMIGVVLGFGHLLSNQPALRAESDDDAKKQQVVVKSLAIIALLSTIDLAWTLAATHAGTMRELNPLGSQIVDDPLRLMLFKLTVTGAALAILYVLHRRPAAQLASWWGCLLLTLLTARWVVFQSMFL